MKSPPDGSVVVVVGATVVVLVVLVLVLVVGVVAGIVVVEVVLGARVVVDVVVDGAAVVLVVGVHAENATFDGRYVWFPLRQHGVPGISLIVCALPPELLVRVSVVGVAASASM
jgi:hypothetical protein